MEEKGTRINKYLSECGVCSRRAADRLIEEGKVRVDGRTAQMGDRVRPGQRVMLDGAEVKAKDQEVFLAFYKPRGIVCTEERREKNNIVDYLQYPVRVFTVGRLDKESEGLLLLTNQGEAADRIMRGRNFHEKEYLVTVDREVTEEFLTAMSRGVPILDTVTRVCQLERTGRKSFRIVLTQGLNRQIRRMCGYFGYRVATLKRIRIMNIRLDGLRPGEYREISREERQQLEKLLGTGGDYDGRRKSKTAGHSAGADEEAGEVAEPGVQSILSGGPGADEQSAV